MRTSIFALFATLTLAACGQDQGSSNLAAIQPGSSLSTSSLTLAPPVQKTVRGQDAELFLAIMERSGLPVQSAIESSFITSEEAFCIRGKAAKFCQFAVGGGLFVRADQDDADALIQLLRRNEVVARPDAQGRKWEVSNLECSSRFDLKSRKLKSTCTFKHFN